MSTIESCAEACLPPLTRVAKPYVFDTPGGKLTFAQLFSGHALLIVQHFSLAACKAQVTDDALAPDHLEHVLTQPEDQDVGLVAVSRAPLAEIEAFKRQMGWQFLWVSSNGCDFNYDFHVTFHSDEAATDKENYNRANCDQAESDGWEAPGTSLFYKSVTGEIFHAYSGRTCFAASNDSPMLHGDLGRDLRQRPAGSFSRGAGRALDVSPGEAWLLTDDDARHRLPQRA